jgi:hypothetical protein
MNWTVDLGDELEAEWDQFPVDVRFWRMEGCSNSSVRSWDGRAWTH